jgi:hypothetical protein
MNTPISSAPQSNSQLLHTLFSLPVYLYKRILLTLIFVVLQRKKYSMATKVFFFCNNHFSENAVLVMSGSELVRGQEGHNNHVHTHFYSFTHF